MRPNDLKHTPTHPRLGSPHHLSGGESRWVTWPKSLSENFEPEEARELFTEYHGEAAESPELLEELLQAIGYHTLTLEILAKNLQVLGSRYSLEQLVARFARQRPLSNKKPGGNRHPLPSSGTLRSPQGHPEGHV